MNRLVLFDVDGTLVRVDGAGREAFRTALQEVYGETGDVDGFDFAGRTDPAIARGLLEPLGRADGWVDASLSRLWSVYVGCLEEELRRRRDRLVVLPGVPELLARLRSDPRFLCGLLTGNVEAGAWTKLRACGLAEAFDFGAFGSDAERRDDLPAVAMRRAAERHGRRFRPEEVVVIGDTPADIRCARAGGVRAVAVATGPYSADELNRHDPDAVLPDLTDARAVIDALQGRTPRTRVR